MVNLKNKTLLAILILVIFVMITLTTYYFFLISKKLFDVTPEVKESVTAVLEKYYTSRLTGGYWENEMILQAEIISKLELNARLDFYRIIILYCNLDTSTAHIFREIVSEDRADLIKYLDKYKKNISYKKLEDTQVKNINDWLFSLKASLKLGLP